MKERWKKDERKMKERWKKDERKMKERWKIYCMVMMLQELRSEPGDSLYDKIFIAWYVLLCDAIFIVGNKIYCMIKYSCMIIIFMMRLVCVCVCVCVCDRICHAIKYLPVPHDFYGWW
jgi:hypothetical protein